MTIELTTSAPPQSAPSPAQRPAAPRSAGLDALRATMVLLVVFHHAAITYGAAGGWYYREVPTDGSLQTRLLILLCAVDQAYFMGLLFLLAGYFTPASLARHGVLGYAKERLLRLGAPLLVFGLLIGPITIALAQTASNRPFLGTLLHLWGRGAFSAGPLWFAFALLIFSFVFIAWRTVRSRLSAEPLAFEPRPFPSNLMLLVAALATGAAAFGLRLVWPVGTTITSDLQLGYFASYIVLFAAGCIGASSQWLDHIPGRQTAFAVCTKRNPVTRGLGGFRSEVQPRRQHWFLNEKSGFPFRTPAFCSVSRGQRRLGEKEYRAPSVTPGVALRDRTQAARPIFDECGDGHYRSQRRAPASRIGRLENQAPFTD